MEITDLTIANVGDDSVEISWRTSKPATTTVKYGEELAAVIYNRETPENESYTLDHQVLLLDLKPETVYHFKAVSISRDGKMVESEDRSFMTMKEGKAEDGAQTTDTQTQTQGFNALMSPKLTSRALGASTQKAPRLNPYADVLGQYDAPTPSPAQYPPSNFPYSYPNYQGGYPYPPVAVVYPPNYAPQQNVQPQVLAQQITPIPTLVPEPTVASKDSVTVTTGGGTALLLIIGVILGIVIAGVYWRLNQTESSGNQPNKEDSKVYKFSIG